MVSSRKVTPEISLIHFLDPIEFPHESFFYQLPFIPRNPKNGLNCTNDTTCDLLGVNTYLDTLKLFVLVVSNNFAERQTNKLFNWLSEDETAQSIMARLLRQNLVSMKVCAEKLLIPAVEKLDRAMLCLLIELGIDLNTRGRQSSYKIALCCAAIKQYAEIFELLLEHGADNWHVPTEIDDWSRYPSKNSLVDFAVERGNVKMLENLLDRELCVVRKHRFDSVKALELAVLQDRIDMVTMIAHRRPEVRESAKKAPWSLFEAAAPCEGTTMVHALMQAVLDIKASKGIYGSPLAVAPAMGNVELVHYLIVAGVDLNVNIVKTKGQPNHERRKTALQLAIVKGHTRIVHLLLQNGADPNYYRIEYAIQLAAYSGNQAIANMLLRFNARVEPPLWRTRSAYAQFDVSLSAICIALETGHLGVVETLSNAGARLARRKIGPISHDCKYQPYDCPIVNHNDEEYRSSERVSFKRGCQDQVR